jgi:Multiubiquitin
MSVVEPIEAKELHEPRQVKVHIDEKVYEFETDDVTGTQIKLKAGIPDTYALYRREPGANEPIADGEAVELHEGDHFFSRPPSNVS